MDGAGGALAACHGASSSRTFLAARMYSSPSHSSTRKRGLPACKGMGTVAEPALWTLRFATFCREEISQSSFQSLSPEYLRISKNYMATFGPSHRPPVLAKSSPFWPRSCQVGDRVFLWDGSTYILWLHRGTGTNRAPASLVAFLNQPKYIEKCATLVELKMFLTAEAFRIRSVTASWL